MLPRAAAVPLFLTLPLVWRAGYALITLALRDRTRARLLATGVGLAAALLAIHVVGLVSHSFHVALFGGLLAVAALGAASLGRLPAAPPAPWPSRFFWLGMLVAVLFLLGPELRFNEHDEWLVASHISIPLQLQNGIYPPRHLTFPQFEYRYHYGFDLAAAVLSSLLGRADMRFSVHLLTLLLWAYCFALFWALGARFAPGKWAAPVTAFGVLFAGGCTFFCWPVKSLANYLVGACSFGGDWVTPPLVSNFLQHPWSLGIPLFACFFFVFAERERQAANPWWWLLLSLLGAMLSLSQVVLFVCVVPTAVAVGSLDGTRVSWTRAVRFAIWGVLLLLLARLMHGFFAPVAEPVGSGLEWHPLWRDLPLVFWAGWNWQSMGFLLPFGILGLWRYGQRGQGERTFLGLLGFGGLAVRNLLRYAHSWDIVKFTMVSQIALALLSAAAISWALEVRRLRRFAVGGFVLVVFFGVAWPLPLTFDMRGLWFTHGFAPPPSPADRAAIDFLRTRVRAGEGVYRSQNPELYAIYGGLPQPSWDWGVESFGFSESLYEARRGLTEHPETSPEALRAQGFVWLVLDPEEPGDVELARAVQRWEASGQARREAVFPPVVVFRL